MGPRPSQPRPRHGARIPDPPSAPPEAARRSGAPEISNPRVGQKKSPDQAKTPKSGTHQRIGEQRRPVHLLPPCTRIHFKNEPEYGVKNSMRTKSMQLTVMADGGLGRLRRGGSDAAGRRRRAGPGHHRNLHATHRRRHRPRAGATNHGPDTYTHAHAHTHPATPCLA